MQFGAHRAFFFFIFIWVPMEENIDKTFLCRSTCAWL